MAAHPPSNPAPSNDGSGIYRRMARKVSPLPLPPEQDELTTLRSSDMDSEESMESLNLQETPLPSSSSVSDLPSELLFPEIAAPHSGLFNKDGLTIPAATAWHDIEPQEPNTMSSQSSNGETEFLESVELVEPESIGQKEELPEPELPLPTQADFDSAALFGLDGNDTDGPAKSSIFVQGGQPLSGTGSGWLDLEADLKSPEAVDDSGTLRPDLLSSVDDDQPATQRFDSASQLFADLAGETPASSTIWEEQATGRIPAKDVSAAFAEANDSPDFELPGGENPESSNLFGPQAISGTLAADLDDDVFSVGSLGSETSGPASSIFKGEGSGEHAALDFENLQLTGNSNDPAMADLFEGQMHDGSSIFDSEASAEFRKLKAIDDAEKAAAKGSSSGPDFDLMKSSPENVSPYNSGLIDFGRGSFGDLNMSDASRPGTQNELNPNTDADVLSDPDSQLQSESIFDGQPALGAMMSAELTKAERDRLEQEEKAERTKAQKKSTAVTGKKSTERQASSGSKSAPKARPSGLKSYGGDVIATEDEPKEKLRGGLGKFVGGTAFGVLAAGIAFGVLYLGGVLPNQKAADQVKVAPPANNIKAGPVAPANLLSSSNPADVIRNLEQVPDEQKSAKINAMLGQARIEQQLSNMAVGSKLDEDEMTKAATSLSTAVQQGSDANAQLEDQQYGVRAALHLGLIKETAGDVAGALSVYAASATKFPTAKRVFDTAVTRLKLMSKRDTSRTSQLLRQKEIESLLHAAVMTSLLIQEKVDTKSVEDEEAGFFYWDAANAATAGKYTEASKLIDKAKAAHDKRRLKLVGKNSNPLSDPQEQIFLRSCDDLKELYTLKAGLYSAPATADIAKKDGSAKALDAALAIGKKIEVLEMEVKTAKANATNSETKAKEYSTQLVANEKQLKDAKEETLKVAQDGKAKLEEIMKDYAASKKTLEEKTTLLTDTEKLLTKAKAEAKIAATAIDTAWVELVKNNVVDDKTDRNKLPEVIKNLALTSNSADAKKAVETIKLLQSKLDDAKLAVTKLEAAKVEQATQMANTVKNSDAKLAEADKKLEALKASIASEIKLAVAKSETGSKDKIDALSKQLGELEKSFALEKTAMEVKFASQLREARTGAAPVVTVAESAMLGVAAKHLADGISNFQVGKYAVAEQHLSESIKSNPADARAWYFLGLAQFQQGKAEEAKKAFRTGADYESRNKPNARVVGDALERVQFSLRSVLAEYRN